MPQNNLIQVGRIVNTHGIKGELKVFPLTNSPELYLDLTEVIFCRKEEIQKIPVTKIRLVKGNKWLLILEGIDSIEKGKALKEEGIFVSESEIPPLEEDEYFIHDLIDSSVYSLEDQYLGKIVDYFETPSNGICKVKDGKKEFLFPTTKEVLQEIFSEEHKVVINLLPGLMELNP